MDKSALARAADLVGGQKPLADRIGTTQSQVWYWLNRAARGVPGEFVIPIEVATDGKVTRHELRPDLYPATPPTHANGEAA